MNNNMLSVSAELSRIEKEITTLQKKCKKLPEGVFYSAKNGKYTKWYIHEKGVTRFVPKSNQNIAQGTLLRELFETKIKELELERSLLKKYVKKMEIIEKRTLRFYGENPDYRKLLGTALAPMEKELQEWMNAEFEGNPYKNEQKVFETNDGHFVRSKSEVMICSALTEKGLPYRYECPLELADGIVYPDFTVMHPKSRKLYYWEHAGMLDNIDYLDHHLQKERRYIRSGIYPDVNLIITHETKDHPLTPRRIAQVIDEYFL